MHIMSFLGKFSFGKNVFAKGIPIIDKLNFLLIKYYNKIVLLKLWIGDIILLQKTI